MNTQKQQWLEAREKECLPVKYFHLVFTLPHELNALALLNPACLYNILFKAAFATIGKFAADSKWLGAQTGGMAILHTWGQNLSFHPHIHILVPAGGIGFCKTEWLKTHPKFFAPVKLMSEQFKQSFLRMLAYTSQTQGFFKPEDYAQTIENVRSKSWVVFAQKPFTGPQRVIRYLGNYTHRIAISNNRIVALQNGRVYFKAKNYTQNGKQKITSLPALEFMRRFLQHVLPPNFYKIRHFGFMANRYRKQNIELALQLLAEQGIYKSRNNKSIPEDIEKALNYFFGKCPHCGGVLMPLIYAEEKSKPIQQHDYG